MHARIEHLLSLRDGEPVAAEVSAHVKSCAICTGELHRLSAIRNEMQALPQSEPPPQGWDRILHTMLERGANRERPRKMAIAAAVLITLATIALIATQSDKHSMEQTPELAETTAPNADELPNLDELVAQSQQLEQLLRKLPERPRVERVSTAAAIDTLQHRIQWLDFQLSTAPEEDLNKEQSRELWRERVELMDSLVKVRYAQAGELWF